MLRRSMTKGGIRVSATPGEDRSAIDNQVTSANEPSTDGSQDTEHKKRFSQRCSTLLSTFALLRWARDTWTAIFAQQQAARQGEGGPVASPVTHILIGQSPQRAQERDEQ
jgi:hypothetical protein